MNLAADDQWMPDNLVRVVTAADPVPYDVLQSLRSCLGRRTFDAELAELVYDSVLDEQVGVRSAQGTRHLSFEGGSVAVEMAVVDDLTNRRVVGQLVPPVPGSVEVRHRDGSFRLDVDAHGRFFAESVPRGPVSLRCRPLGSDEVLAVTDWVAL